jgi:site-specific DNA-cytosine methylase
MGYNVLSLFDGGSCCQEALKISGIKVDNYFACEIEKSSIKITQKNFPNTIQLGDVRNINADYFKKLGIKIDIITAGSPCQDLSISNTSGQGLRGERSGLFYQFYRLLNELQPTYYLLENVPMLKIWENEISDLLGVQPVKINSNLFSSQNRNRLYWTNIPIPQLPENNPLVFNDIMYDNNYKVFKLDKQQILSKRITRSGYIQWDSNGKKNNSQWDRAYFSDKKICTLSKGISQNINICVDYDNDIYRKLHPIEAERLQTLPDNYTLVNGVPEYKRFEMLGNGWTVDVISFIFNSLK